LPTQRVSTARTVESSWRGPLTLIGGVLLGIAMSAAWLAPKLHESRSDGAPPEARPSIRPISHSIPVRASQGKLTHPLLTCSSEPSDAADLAAVKAQVVRILATGKRAGVTRAAVHVSDLETCQWFEIGAEEQFHPASVMKLPLALTWLRRASQDASVLTRTLVYTLPADAETREDKTLPVALVTGQSYEVADLLRRMLVESRNDAKWLLSRDLPTDALDEIWRDLGLTPPPRDQDPQVDVHAIALMLHALYDGAWLGRDASERALAWLADATFVEGLAAKLPPRSVVAHKYGRRVRTPPPQQKDGHAQWWLQLHDCGILYRAGHPMLACVMTEGMNEPEQQRVIQEIAALLWSYPQAPL
jgi:hypothetical protein